MNEHEWETVNETKTSITSRLKIEGGFLYHLSARNSRDVHTSMCFVPDSPTKNILNELPKFKNGEEVKEVTLPYIKDNTDIWRG